MLTSAVVGLGQVGSRFDEEARPAVWSHVGAYLALPGLYTLAAAADLDATNRGFFARRCPTVPVYDDPLAMVEQVRPDVLSLCTPPAGRADLVEHLLARHRPRVLICEKPLAADGESRHRVLTACRKAGVPALVNYNRRHSHLYREARRLIADGTLGTVTAITVTVPNRLWSMGSHALNLLLHLAGEEPEEWTALPLPALAEEGEPAADVLLRFPSGIAGRMVTAGFKRMLVVETQVFGTLGRLSVGDQERTLDFTPFQPSPHYANYLVAGPSQCLARRDETESAFVTIAREAADLAQGRRHVPTSPVETAFASESILDSIAARCRNERTSP